MKAVVFFYDSEDINTGMFHMLQTALSEDYALVIGNEIIPFDECSIIYWYDGKYYELAAEEFIKEITGQEFNYRAPLSEMQS